MFDLNHAISEWRRQMSAGGVKDSVVLDELESHLREDIGNELRTGENVERAFAMAVKRLGAADVLKPEFEKAMRERKRDWWRAGSVVGGTLLAYSAVFTTWVIEWRMGKIEITGAQLLVMLGSMLATMLFGFVGRSVGNRLPLILNEQRQAAFILVAIMLSGASLRLLWNWLSFDDLVWTQAILLWTMSPLLGVGHCFSVWNQRCYAAREQIAA